MRLTRFVRNLAFLTILVCMGCLNGFGDHGALREAEEFSRKGEYDKAIEAYHRHIDVRVNAKNRPEWENPYFYLILIGDIELGRENVNEALASYEEAEKNGVDKSLVSDRYRSAARYYEEHGSLKDAIEVLNKYKDRDPLLFESMLDRLSKELVRKEERP